MSPTREKDPNMSTEPLTRGPASGERSPDDPSPCREKPYFIDKRTEEGDHDPELPVPVFLGLECGDVGAVDGGEGVDDRAGVECCGLEVKEVVEDGTKSGEIGE